MKNFLAKLLQRPGSSWHARELYALVPPASTERLGRWHEAFPAYDEVVGYSALGHFFLRASASQEYAVVYPFKIAAKSYGVFSTVEAFEDNVLKDPGFEEYVLSPEHVASIRQRLGPLKENEIYIPEPYPFLGGSEEPDTYAKGNVWVFANILGEMIELEGDD